MLEVIFHREARMSEKLGASLYSGLTCAVVGFLFLQLNEYLFFSWSSQSIFYGAFGFVTYFILGLVFSFFLLFGLDWSISKLSLFNSCFLFICVGFSVASYLSYESSLLSSHGQNPFIGETKARNIFGVISFGVMGASSALSAWVYLVFAKN